VPDYSEQLAAAIAAAWDAGSILREGLHRPEDSTLVTAAEAVLRRRLQEATPWGYVCGDTRIAGADATHTWLVTPDDGARRNGGFTRGQAVVIAAVRDDEPVLAVVNCYAYPDHTGDLIAWAENEGALEYPSHAGGVWFRRNDRPVDAAVVDIPLDAPAVTFDDRLIVTMPPEADDHPHATGQRLAPARFITLRSPAYRAALVALGESVAAGWTQDESNPATEAAIRALMKAAGGVIGTRNLITFCGGAMAVAALDRRPWTEPPPPAPPDPGPPLVRPSRYSAARLTGRVIDDPGILSRAQGCLLGQAAGDALGGLVEFEDKETIHRRYPHGCRDLRDGGTWNNLAGQPTDDTELALLLARSIVHAGRYDRDIVLQAYIDWWTDPRTFDRGGTIGRALSAAAKASSYSDRLAQIDLSANRQSQANGSLMRISPLGIYAAGTPDHAAEMALHESRLTHPHPVCGQSCAVYAAAIAHAIGTGCGPHGAYEEALRQAGRLDVDISVREALIRAHSTPPADYYTNQGWVLLALQNAFYQLLNAATLEEGIVATVMSGGDTDTTGAIAGALLGAVHGRRAIPPRWVRTILCCRTHAGSPTDHKRAREYWPCDVLELAELLLLAGRG
jgi:ADP-ribosylglycohydrolase/fructose-1,6-bisphosphatase/inositol monophosphatase family enzyme